MTTNPDDIRRAYKRMANAGHRPMMTDPCRCKINDEANRYARLWPHSPHTQLTDIYTSEAAKLIHDGKDELAQKIIDLAKP